MFFKTVLLLLVFGLHAGYGKKSIKTSNPSSFSNGESNGDDLTSRQNDLVKLLQSQLNSHERKLHEAYNLVHQQAEKLSQQERILHQQAETLDKQGRLLERLVLKATHTDPQTDRIYSINHLETRSDDNGPLQVAMDQMSLKITTMAAQIQSLQAAYHQIQDVQASTFVHWGSSHCSSDNAELVYSGVVGGSYYSHSGAPANPLCLTMQPVPSNRSIPSAVAYLYGSEYYTYDDHINKDPVCAVCRSRYSTTIMLPGTNVCSPGWHLDYDGFLMAGTYNQGGSSEYICVDSKFESRVGGDSKQYGMLLYFTVSQCGSLPCEPYKHDTVVTCAVCSK